MPTIGDLLRQSSSKAELSLSLGELQREIDRAKETFDAKAGRAIHVQRVPVLDYKPASDDNIDHLAQRGTLTVFIARQGDRWIRRVREAVAENGRDAELAREIRQQFHDREILPRETAERLYRSQPLLADLRYGQKPLVSDLFPPPDGGPAVLVLAYSGGPISTESFSLVEYIDRETEERLEGIIVRHSPNLTPAEEVALREVPETMSDLHVGNASFIGTCIWYASAVAVAAEAFMTYTAGCAKGAREPHIDEARLREIGPLATAQELLHLRREILAGRGS